MHYDLPWLPLIQIFSVLHTVYLDSHHWDTQPNETIFLLVQIGLHKINGRNFCRVRCFLNQHNFSRLVCIQMWRSCTILHKRMRIPFHHIVGNCWNSFFTSCYIFMLLFLLKLKGSAMKKITRSVLHLFTFSHFF